MAEAGAASQAEVPPVEDWHEEAKRNLINLYMAEKAWMLDKWQRQQEEVYKDMEFARTGVSGTASGSSSGDDSMGVSVGNTVHNYYQQATATDNSTTTTPAETAKPAATKTLDLSWLKTAAVIGGALLAGGSGAGVVNWLTAPKVTITNPVTGDDTNAGLRFKD